MVKQTIGQKKFTPLKKKSSEIDSFEEECSIESSKSKKSDSEAEIKITIEQRISSESSDSEERSPTKRNGKKESLYEREGDDDDYIRGIM